jgi:dTDP-4-dehydrorhamnose 3,5-epimerase
MNITKTIFPGVLLIHPALFHDDRGVFLENYNLLRYTESGISHDWVQDNLSSSSYGVIRGLHYQLNPFAQAKIVQVIRGKIQDVVVDIRKESPTYGRSISVILDSEERTQILIPRGFAHGFSVLSEVADVLYKTDNYYSKNHEAGILFNDPDLAIDWMIPADKVIVSPKDTELSRFADVVTNFQYNS